MHSYILKKYKQNKLLFCYDKKDIIQREYYEKYVSTSIQIYTLIARDPLIIPFEK